MARLLELINNQGIRKNLVNSLFYFGGTFVQFLVAIVTQPIYSKYLELSDFALIGYFTAIQALLYSLFNMCLPYYYLSRYWHIENGETPEKNMSFILNFLNISNGVVAVVSFIGISFFFKRLDVIFPLTPFIFIVLAQLFIEKFKTYFLIDCRAQKRGLHFFLLNLLQIILNAAFSLYFVIVLKTGAAGRMSGILAAVIISSVVATVILIKEKKYVPSFNIDRKKLMVALKYCVPLIVASYATYPLDNIDRLFLERLGNANEYGYYSIGLTIAGFVSTFFIALFQSFEPDLYRFVAQRELKKYMLFATIYVGIIVAVAVLYLLFSETVVSFLTSGRYTHATEYANIFVIAIVFMQIGGFFEQLFTAYGATHLVMWRNLILGIFSIVIYYAMIKSYDFVGAKSSRVICALLYLVLGAVMFWFYMRTRRGREKYNAADTVR